MTFGKWLCGVVKNKHGEISSEALTKEAKRYAAMFGGKPDYYMSELFNQRILTPGAGNTWHLNKWKVKR